MASFDFIDASAKAYDFIFKYFIYLAKVSVPVLFLMVLCQLMTIAFFQDMSVLRFGLVMFPAYLIQGVYSVALVRFALYNEPIHIWGTPIQTPQIESRPQNQLFLHGSLSQRQSIQGGMVCYTLIYTMCMGIMGALELMAHSAMESERANPPDVSQQDLESAKFTSFIMLIPIAVSMVWLIKLCFIYLSTAMGFRFSTYMKAMQGIYPSVLLGLTLMICSLPVYAVSIPVMNLVLFLFKPIAVVAPVVFIVLTSVMLLISQSVIVLAAAFGINKAIEDSGLRQ